MIQFFWSEDETVLVKIAGDNFIPLMELIKSANGKFEHNKRTALGDVVDKVWEVDQHVAYDLACRLDKVETVRVPNWIKPVEASDDKEFVRYRASVDPKLVNGDWKGDFQRKGVLRGISQNRLALFWEMGCVAEGTVVTVKRNNGPNIKKLTVEDLYRWKNSPKVKGGREISIRCLKADHFGQHPAVDVVYSGEKECVELLLESGKKISLTPDHEILTLTGWVQAGDLTVGSVVITNGTPVCKDCGSTERVSSNPKHKHFGLCRKCMLHKRNTRIRDGMYETVGEDGYVYLHGKEAKNHPNHRTDGLPKHRYVMSCVLGRPLLPTEHVHHKDGNPKNNDPSNLEVLTPTDHCKRHVESSIKNLQKDFIKKNGTEVVVVPREDSVVSVTPVGIKKTYDIKMTAPFHNFVANGIVVHNCGKTFTIQTILNHLVERNDIKKYVVLSPPEGVINLAYEFLRFNTFGLTREQIYICSTENRNPFTDPNIRVIILSYRNLIMLHDDFRKATGKTSRSSRVAKNYIPFEKLGDKLALVCDESSLIRNPDSKTFKVLDKAKGFFDYRYMLSGTPAPKYAANLWAQFHILSPKSVPADYNTFLRSVASVGNRFSPYAVNFYYDDKVEAFLKSVEHLVSREMAAGNLNLPPLIIKPIRCQLSTRQKQIYQMVVDSTLASIREEHGQLIPSIVRNKFMHLSLALHDPGLLLEGSLDPSRTTPALMALLKSWKFEQNGKLEITDSLLEHHIEDQGEKAILWSGHPYILDKLNTYYEKYHPYVLHGETEKLKKESTAERNYRIVEAFKADKKSKLLLANYKVVKTSVNITEVTYNCFWDRSWDFEEFYQPLKRTHRIGQEKSVRVDSLMFAGSLEEQQDEEIENRASFNDHIWRAPSLDLQACKAIFTGKF